MKASETENHINLGIPPPLTAPRMGEGEGDTDHRRSLPPCGGGLGSGGLTPVARHLKSPLNYIAVLLCTLSLSTPTRAAPQRIVSLNVCADQILIDLVDRERIAAVSYLATDPLSSAKPERAEGLATTKGAAEDVLAYQPDLILAGEYSTPATVDLLRRLGHRVELLPMPDSLAGIRDLIRKVATATGDDQQGDALIHDFDRRIEVVRTRASHMQSRPRALVYQVNNFVSRSGSLIDEMLQLAGFDNTAKDLPGGRSGAVAIESIVTRPPDILILASGPDTYLASVADNLRHPALQRIAHAVPTMVLPWPLWLCGTHHVADAIEKLVDAREKLAVKP